MEVPVLNTKHSYALQKITPLTIVKASLIYSALFFLCLSVISLSPSQEKYFTFLLVGSVLTLILTVLIIIRLYYGMIVTSDKFSIRDIIKLRKLGFLKPQWLQDFMTTADGFAGLVIGFLLWIIGGMILLLVYYVFGSVLVVTASIFGYLINLIFFKGLRNIFLFAPKCQGSLTNSIILALVYAILYNSFLFIIFCIIFSICNI